MLKVKSKFKLNKKEPSDHKIPQAIPLQSVISLLHGTTLLSTSLILQEEKLLPESLEAWKLSQIETSHLPTQLCKQQSMSSIVLSNLISQQSTSRWEQEEVLETRPPDLVLNQPLELLPVMESKSVVLRTWLQFPLTQPVKVLEKVEDFDCECYIYL